MYYRYYSQCFVKIFPPQQWLFVVCSQCLRLPSYTSSMSVTGVDISFSLQHGLVRDTITINAAHLTLKTLKDEACNFIDTKVSVLLLKYKKHYLSQCVLRTSDMPMHRYLNPIVHEFDISI